MSDNFNKPEQGPNKRPYAEHLDDSEIAALMEEAQINPMPTDRKDRIDTRVFDAIDDPEYKARLEAAEDILNPTEVPEADVAGEVGDLAVVNELADLDFGPSSPEQALDSQLLRDHVQKGSNPYPKPTGSKDRVWPPKNPSQ